MSIIYPYKRVRDGCVPMERDILQSADDIRRWLERHKGIVSASLYGSVATGSVSRTSDIDAIMICLDASEAALIHERSELMHTFQKRFVSANIEIVPRSLASTPLHSVGYGLASHLQRVHAKGSIKGSVVGDLNLSQESAANELRRYLKSKNRQLLEMLDIPLTPEQFYLSLAQSLDSPIHLARKILEYWGQNLPDDSKGAVIDCWDSQSAATKGFESTPMRGIYNVGRMYKQVLMRQFELPNEQDYAAMIDTLHVNCGTAYQYFKNAAIYFGTRMPA